MVEICPAGGGIEPVSWACLYLKDGVHEADVAPIDESSRAQSDAFAGEDSRVVLQEIPQLHLLLIVQICSNLFDSRCFLLSVPGGCLLLQEPNEVGHLQE